MDRARHQLGHVQQHSGLRRRSRQPTTSVSSQLRPPAWRADARKCTLLLADSPISCEGVAHDMRKIDVFNHIFPEQYVTRMGEVAPGLKDAGKRVRGVPMLVDLDVRFRVMDAVRGLPANPVDRHAANRGLCEPGRRRGSGSTRQRWHGGARRGATRIAFQDSSPRCP